MSARPQGRALFLREDRPRSCRHLDGEEWEIFMGALPLRRQHFKLIGLLMAAFMAVTSLIAWQLYTSTVESRMVDLKGDLATSAVLLSELIDGDKHDQLNDPDQMDGPLYKEMIGKLGQAQVQVPSITYIYTLKPVGNTFNFILDPTEPGDHDKDGIDDKSYLMDEYGEISPRAREAYLNGHVSVEDELTSDRWGTFLSAYAPIRNSAGKTVGILGIDIDASTVQKELNAERDRVLQIVGLSWILSLALAVLLIAPLNDQGKLAHLLWRHTKSGTSSGRFVILQVALITLVTGMGIAGVQGYESAKRDFQNLKQLDAKDQKLSSVKDLAIEVMATGGDATRLRSLDISLSKVGVYLTDGTLKRVSEAEPKSAEWMFQLRRLIDVLNIEAGHINRERQLLLNRIENRRESYALILLLAFAMVTGSMIVVRIAAAQQTRLEHIAAESDQLRHSYQHVVEHLPVGLFQYKDGKCSFSNCTLDFQTRRQSLESVGDAVTRALHPDDRERFLDDLADHQQREAILRRQYRMLTSDSKVAHFEAHGIPIFDEKGRFMHLLCFMVDVTDIVESSESLQRKNKEFEATNDRLVAVLGDLEANFTAMVQAWVKAVEAKDPYTAGHSERVKHYSMLIGRAAGLTPYELKTLEMGTLVHDIGKIGIPDAVLTKPDKLTDAEYGLIKSHAAIGSDILNRIPQFVDCLPIVRWHHERLDGSGYPDGLKDREIPDLVRIAAVADCYDAMTSTRAYRKGMSVEKALAELRKDAELGRLDGKFVEILADIIERGGLEGDQPLSKAA
jgi:HD-GYP domain-containing protein (c-di-GMP phosphodiesterase class II)